MFLMLRKSCMVSLPRTLPADPYILDQLLKILNSLSWDIFRENKSIHLTSPVGYMISTSGHVWRNKSLPTHSTRVCEQ